MTDLLSAFELLAEKLVSFNPAIWLVFLTTSIALEMVFLFLFRMFFHHDSLLTSSTVLYS
jgi:hypothetical protein